MLKYSLALLAAIAAVEASPFPQAVTAAISPSSPAPSGCLPTFTGSFGIVNVNVTATSGAAGGQATQNPDGQPGAGSTLSGAVKQTSDGQPQGGVTAVPVSVISDGQIQAGTKTQMMMPVTQINDGQIQGPTVVVLPASQISDGQPQVAPQPKTTAISQISDGQPQAATAQPVSQISDGQPQAATAKPVSQISDGQPQAATATPASQISDGQPQAPAATGASQKPDGQPNVATGAGQAGDGQPTGAASGSSSGSTSFAFCQTDNTLALTLSNGILKDAKGRTGYIASNFQFQFDAPPQAGAIYTAGFSVCSNGTLALGGSSIFWQCLSGNFYNLYDRNWAAQCNAVYIQTGKLVQCS